MTNWDVRFLDLAKEIAKWSKDRRKQVGCIIVGPNKEIRTTGYNGFPRNVNDDIEERHSQEEKLFWTCHAEINAIVNAARCAIPLDGCKLFTTAFPCSACAQAIIQAGIIEIITDHTPKLDHPKWGEHFKRSLIMFKEASIIINLLQ